MTSPYADLPPRAFWRSAVAGRGGAAPVDLWQPKFAISPQARIVTAGSCFAQHVGRALKQAGFAVMDTEPLPAEIPDAVAQRFGYRLYSARYGNIYTARQLWQLIREARGKMTPALPVWQRDGRFFDAQRPGVEPDGLDSPDLVLAHRAEHLAAVRQAFGRAEVLVFTFGLTEAWLHRDTGTVYPTAPGTVAGDFDPEVFAFHNFDMAEVLADFERVRSLLRARNPDMRFLVTVSPVPLTATASGQHVEVATAYSKAVLRAVCGSLVARHDDVDYFPSYEIITSQAARGQFYDANLRNVTERGVETAMRLFLQAQGITPPLAGAEPPATGTSVGEPGAEVVCEDALLEAFAR